MLCLPPGTNKWTWEEGTEDTSTWGILGLAQEACPMRVRLGLLECQEGVMNGHC